jgi:hypothetical protein
MLSVRQIGKVITKLRINSESIVVIKMDDKERGASIASVIGQFFKDRELASPIMFVIVGESEDISVMKPEDMRKFGWYRLQDAIGIINRRLQGAFSKEEKVEDTDAASGTGADSQQD